MMIPNTFGMLSRFTGMNGYSEPSYAAAVRVPCAVVHVNKIVAKTSVRTDQSASHGAIEETTSVSKILFQANVAIGIEDKFEILGVKLRATGIQPRNTVLGALDHNEVDFGILPA